MKVWILIRYMSLLLFALPTGSLLAQNKASVGIKAQAEVINKTEIELVTIKDLEIEESMAREGVIRISAKYDSQAAVMVVKGRYNAKFRISFVPVVEIVNSIGPGKLLMHYDIYGYSRDNQSASEPIDAVERILQLDSDGKYYLWVGGRIDISKAMPGCYYGNFTIKIEYI